MGLFTKEYQCKLCDKHVSEDMYVSEFDICVSCFLIMKSSVDTMLEFIPELQSKADNAETPDKKIVYLKTMLDLMYEYKIKYVDNGVNVIEQDILELIDNVIDSIAEAKL